MDKICREQTAVLQTSHPCQEKFVITWSLFLICSWNDLKKAILLLSAKWRLVKMCQQPVIYHPQIIFCCVFLTGVHLSLANTPNANMADHSVGARDKSHESEVSQALMFCFHNAFPEKSCFIVDLVPLFRPLYLFLCSWMPPQESEIFHSRESVLFFSYLVCL